MSEARHLDALWAQRHTATALADFESALVAALASDSQRTALLWRFARAKHFYAMQADEKNHPSAAARLFSEGATLAERALKTAPRNATTLFWAASCGLEAARARGVLTALRALPTARRRLECAAELDETFHYAGPLRVLGRLAHRTPSWLGGDLNEALVLYERALKHAPGHPTTLLYLAEALLDASRREEARKPLEEIVAAPQFPDWQWEQERDRRQARSLLATLARR